VQPRRLDRSDEHAIEELLDVDVTTNLFLLAYLSIHPVDRAHWYGSFTPNQSDQLAAAVLVVPGRLAVPFARTEDAARELGSLLRSRHPPSMVVGPRVTSDAMWSTWAPEARVIRWYDQRLYVLHRPAPAARPMGFRRAMEDDIPEVDALSAAMEIEDTGIDPRAESAQAHRMAVQERVRSGRTYLIERGGEIVFQVHVGTVSSRGCQVGGTYVPPRHRGKGLGGAGVAATCDTLLRSYPLVTLHVNEANRPAVAVYERCGFQRSTPMRLLTVQGST
jgi:RimJ/RimL family protein N-acetyltransferase